MLSNELVDALMDADDELEALHESDPLRAKATLEALAKAMVPNPLNLLDPLNKMDPLNPVDPAALARRVAAGPDFGWAVDTVQSRTFLLGLEASPCSSVKGVDAVMEKLRLREELRDRDELG